MKFKLFGKTIEIKNGASQLPPAQNDDEWAAYLAGRGYSISANAALKVAAVLRCVDVVAKTMASLPLELFREMEQGREKAITHPLYRILHRLPNRHTTAYEFWHMYVANVLLTTGGFAKILRDRRGFVAGLLNIPTANVSDIQTNKVNGERYIYVITDIGATEVLRDGEFMYTPGMRFSSDTAPEDPMTIAADVLGLTRDLNSYAQSAFEEGANPGGFVEHPGALSEEAYERFKADFKQNYMGALNAHKWLFLEEGAKANPYSRDLEKSQALESRKFAVTEICRIFGVPPHKVFDLERATFSNIEQQNIEFVQESIAPMAVRLEQTIYKDLLTEKEQDAYFAKFNVNGLLRGDIAARTAFYHSGRQDGWLNANDIRRLEDMNDISKEDGGDVYCVNGNYIPLSSVPQNLPKGAKQ